MKQHQLWELALPILEAINFRRWPMTSKLFNGYTKAMYYDSLFNLSLVLLPFQFSPKLNERTPRQSAQTQWILLA